MILKTGNPFRKYAERQVQKKYPAVFELLNDKKLRETDQTAITIKANKVYKSIKERKRRKEEISEAKKRLLAEIRYEKTHPTAKDMDEMNNGLTSSRTWHSSYNAVVVPILITGAYAVVGTLAGASAQPWFTLVGIGVALVSMFGAGYGNRLYSAAKIKTLEDAVKDLDDAYAKIGKA